MEIDEIFACLKCGHKSVHNPCPQCGDDVNKKNKKRVVMSTHCGLKLDDEVKVETSGAIGDVIALLPDGEVCVDLGLYSRVYHCTILNYPE